MTKPNTGTKDARKKALSVTCTKCKRIVDSKSTVSCSICSKNYEYDCIGYSEKLHRLKDTEAKKNWKCKTCEKKSKGYTTPSSASSTVTLRRKPSPFKNIKSTSSNKLSGHFETLQSTPKVDASPIIDADHCLQAVTGSPATTQADLSLTTEAEDSSVSGMVDSHVFSSRSESLELLDTSDKIMSKSIDFTEIELTQIQDLKDNFRLLSSKYEILQNELDNTLLDNNKLQQQINKLNKENETLRALCSRHSVVLSYLAIALKNINNLGDVLTILYQLVNLLGPQYITKRFNSKIPLLSLY
jgi:dynactin complex subunit